MKVESNETEVRVINQEPYGVMVLDLDSGMTSFSGEVPWQTFQKMNKTLKRELNNIRNNDIELD
ncbi:hypothetical protein [Bacillus phage YungSlug]|nr:hypothetical protein [Bacillus phage YungSlug]